MAFSLADAYAMRRRRPVATIGILAVCVLVWLLMSGTHLLSIPSPERAVAFGAQLNDAAASERWRLLSAAFVHFGWIHLLFNGYALWILGTFQERFFGPGRFLLIYLTAALTGNLATAWLLPPDVPSAGASGAVFGLLGTQLALELLKTLPPAFHRPLWKGVLPWIVLNLALGLGINSLGTDVALNNYAHVGGLVGGAAVTVALRGAGASSWKDVPALLGAALAVLALVCCGMAIRHGVTTDPSYLLFGHP